MVVFETRGNAGSQTKNKTGAEARPGRWKIIHSRGPWDPCAAWHSIEWMKEDEWYGLEVERDDWNSYLSVVEIVSDCALCSWTRFRSRTTVLMPARTGPKNSSRSEVFPNGSHVVRPSSTSSEVVWIEMLQLSHSTEDSLVWLKSLENILVTANGSKLKRVTNGQWRGALFDSANAAVGLHRFR